MPIKKTKRNPRYRVPLRNEITIIACEKNCGLGCNDDN